jgi:hypothetical protein
MGSLGKPASTAGGGVPVVLGNELPAQGTRRAPIRSLAALIGPRAPRAAGVVLAALLAGCLLLVVLHLANEALGYTFIFDLDRERNLPTWLSTALFALVAGVCGVAASFLRPSHIVAWSVMGALFAFVSLDEQSGVHEHLTARAGGGDGEPLWLLLYVPLGLAGLAAARSAAGDLRRWLGSARVLAVALGCFALAALAEAVGGGIDRDSTLWTAEVIVEEVAELLAASVLLAGLVGALAPRLSGRR